MQRLIYILAYPIIWLVSILPFPVLYFVSDCIYVLVYYLVGYRKKVVRDNLELAFPNKSAEEINTIIKKFYHHLCDMMVESVKSLTISEKELKKRFIYHNVDQIHELERLNKSLIIMGSHYASWEWLFILQRQINHKGYVVYKRIENKYFDKLIRDIRAKYDTELITTKETIHKLGASKIRGELTANGFLCDQSAKHWKAKHWQKFMGIKVPVITGAEMLAKKLDMAVVFLSVKKIKRGYYEATLKTHTIHPREIENYQITDDFLAMVESQIKEEPAYYLWTHKRWKYRDQVPPEFQ